MLFYYDILRTYLGRADAMCINVSSYDWQNRYFVSGGLSPHIHCFHFVIIACSCAAHIKLSVSNCKYNHLSQLLDLIKSTVGVFCWDLKNCIDISYTVAPHFFVTICFSAIFRTFLFVT